MAKTLTKLRQLEQGTAPGQIIVTGATNEPTFLSGGTTGQVPVKQPSGELAFEDAVKIAAGSAAFLSVNAQKEIEVSALAITAVTTDTGSADLATFVGASYTVGNEFQEGDVVILSTPGEAYIHNGGTAGTVADFTQLQAPQLSDAVIRALFSSANSAINYNATTGVFTFTIDPAAANDLSISGNGLFLDVSASNVQDTNNVVTGSTGGTTQVTLQDILDALSAPKDILNFASARVVSGIASGFTNLATILDAQTPTVDDPFYLADVDGDTYLIYDEGNDLYTIDPSARNKVVFFNEQQQRVEEALAPEETTFSTIQYKVFPIDFGNIVIDGTSFIVGNDYKFNYTQLRSSIANTLSTTDTNTVQAPNSSNTAIDAASGDTLTTKDWVLANTSALPTGALGDILFNNGSSFVKATPVKDIQTISGTSTTLPSTPITGGQVDVYLNGSLQEEGAGNDYTLSGTTITWLSTLVSDKVTTIYLTA